MSKRIKVIESIFKPAPLLDTEKAAIIEFYDENNQLEAILSRVLDGFWCLTTKKDPDWLDTLARLGYMAIPSRTIQELIN